MQYAVMREMGLSGTETTVFLRRKIFSEFSATMHISHGTYIGGLLYTRPVLF